LDFPHDLDENSLAAAWAYLRAHADAGLPLRPNAYRMAFADPEFMARRETRGIRIQLELLKPDVDQQEQGINNTVVVFGSARFSSPEAAQQLLDQARKGGDAIALKEAERHMRNAAYYDMAHRFGHIVATHSAALPEDERLYICTGGGPGIMEAANRGAHEAGALTVGLNIALPHEQQANPYVTPSLSFKFHYFAARKMHFMMRAKAMVAFPGGFGTLDELFEVITLVQTKKSAPVPIILFGKDYWNRLINMDVMVEEGAVSESDLNLFKFTDDPQEAWDTIQAFYKL
jgi:uncharacterized protein (TIGR00730 family)